MGGSGSRLCPPTAAVLNSDLDGAGTQSLPKANFLLRLFFWVILPLLLPSTWGGWVPGEDESRNGWSPAQLSTSHVWQLPTLNLPRL